MTVRKSAVAVVVASNDPYASVLPRSRHRCPANGQPQHVVHYTLGGSYPTTPATPPRKTARQNLRLRGSANGSTPRCLLCLTRQYIPALSPIRYQVRRRKRAGATPEMRLLVHGTKCKRVKKGLGAPASWRTNGAAWITGGICQFTRTPLRTPLRASTLRRQFLRWGEIFTKTSASMIVRYVSASDTPISSPIRDILYYKIHKSNHKNGET